MSLSIEAFEGSRWRLRRTRQQPVCVFNCVLVLTWDVAGAALCLLASCCIVGTIPGSVYWWPKNVLHWRGIDRSILDINSTMPAHFVIADGIVTMEGNGPLQGTARDLGRIVMSNYPVAADFTCARLMGFDPYRISHLAQGRSVSRQW